MQQNQKYKIGILEPEDNVTEVFNLFKQYGEIELITPNNYFVRANECDVIVVPSYINSPSSIAFFPLQKENVKAEVSTLGGEFRLIISEFLKEYDGPVVYLGNSGIFHLSEKGARFSYLPGEYITSCLFYMSPSRNVRPERHHFTANLQGKLNQPPQFWQPKAFEANISKQVYRRTRRDDFQPYEQNAIAVQNAKDLVLLTSPENFHNKPDSWVFSLTQKAYGDYVFHTLFKRLLLKYGRQDTSE